MISHKKVYENLMEGFNENQSRIMSETLVELIEHQDAKFAKRMDEQAAKFDKRGDEQMACLQKGLDEQRKRGDEQVARLKESLDEQRKRGDEQVVLLKQSLDEQRKLSDEKWMLVYKSIAELESRLTQRIDRMATKEDLHRELYLLTWRMFTGLVACFGIIAGLVYFLVNHAHLTK